MEFIFIDETGRNENMNTILFTWNPHKWAWNDLPQAVAEANIEGRHVHRWSCGVTRRIAPGDRAFLMRLGLTPKGIMGSGVVVTPPKEKPHWDADRAANGDTALYVEILFDVLNATPIIGQKMLSSSALSSQNWYPQASGTLLAPDLASVLESEWANVTGTQFVPPTKEELPTLYFEGTRRTRLITACERNSEARERCIAHHGARCTVCGLVFDERYGDIGAGFIHVHHLLPMAEIDGTYEVDPVHDLCPVCPNCHAMLHRRPRPFTPEELKKNMRDSKNNVEYDTPHIPEPD